MNSNEGQQRAIPVTEHRKIELPGLAEKAYMHVKEGIMITDDQANILLVNDSFTKATGYQQEEAIGKDICFFCLQVDKKCFYDMVMKAIGEEGCWQGDVWGQRKNGEIYYKHLTISPITDNNRRITHYVGSFYDITEREKLRNDIMKTGEVQRNSLPPPMMDSRFEIVTLYQPKRYVSGDFYDYILSEDKQKLTGFVMDFMGHGLSTAFQASGIRVLFRQMVNFDIPLGKSVEWLNKEALKCFNDESFAAAIFYEFDFQYRSLTITAAGINYLFCKTRELEPFVKVKGTFLGIKENATFEQLTIPIHKGDYFLFLSDGFLDAIPKTFTEENQDFPDAINSLNQNLPLQKGKDDCTAVCFLID